MESGTLPAFGTLKGLPGTIRLFYYISTKNHAIGSLVCGLMLDKVKHRQLESRRIFSH